jgi:nicotinamidase-related amidase
MLGMNACKFKKSLFFDFATSESCAESAPPCMKPALWHIFHAYRASFMGGSEVDMSQSPGGKCISILWMSYLRTFKKSFWDQESHTDLAREVAESVDLLAHLREIVSAARQAAIPIFFVPHHRWEPGDYTTWKYPTPHQLADGQLGVFAKGRWGGEFHPDFPALKGDIVIKEQWAQSGFANTDLDQQLKQHGIQRLVLIGMLANTCIESTSRFGMELGYHVTLVKDATAASSREAMHNLA